MTGYAGIDAGGTLIKIAYLCADRFDIGGKEADTVSFGQPASCAEVEETQTTSGSDAQKVEKTRKASPLPVLVRFPSDRMQSAVDWVRRNVPHGTRIGFTGGQAKRLSEWLPEYASDAVDVAEFEATAEGAVRILQSEAEGADTVAGRLVLVNVGTGTSLHLVDGAERTRLGGIGLGGGTIVGLTGLLCGVRDYEEIARLAPLGDREAVDLTVGQIYAPAQPPIAGDLTAANFARQIPPATGMKPQDYAAAVIGMVAELVVTVGVQAAGLQGTSKVVYVGSSYENNALLRDLTFRFTAMLGAQAEIPRYGSYSGAIGALYLVKATEV